MKYYYKPRFSLLCLVLIFGSLIGGCLSWQTKTVITYQVAGDILQAAKPVLQDFCKEDVFTAEECKDARKAYNDAVSVYKLLGSAAIIAIDTGNDGSYRLMQSQLVLLLDQLAEFTRGR